MLHDGKSLTDDLVEHESNHGLWQALLGLVTAMVCFVVYLYTGSLWTLLGLVLPGLGFLIVYVLLLVVGYRNNPLEVTARWFEDNVAIVDWIDGPFNVTRYWPGNKRRVK